MADSKTPEIFNSPNSQYFFAKISGIGLTYMVVSLSDMSSKKG